MKRRNVKNSSIILQLMRVLSDSYRHKGLRKQLVELIRNKGIRMIGFYRLFWKFPGIILLILPLIRMPMKTAPFPIAEGQTISQPYTVAYQTQLLDIKPHEKVLEVGTGSGYQACCIWL